MAHSYYCPTCRLTVPEDTTQFDYVKGCRVHYIVHFPMLASGLDPIPLKHEAHRVEPVRREVHHAAE